MAEQRRAWSVQDPNREVGIVIFAESRGKARTSGAGQLDSDWLDVEVKRAASFDELDGKEITPRDYLLRGWWQGCTRCLDRVHEDDEDGAFVNADGYAVCSRCARKDGSSLERIGTAMAALGDAGAAE